MGNDVLGLIKANNYISYIDFEIAKMLKSLGWDLHTSIQYLNGNLVSLDLGECVLLEMTSKSKELYYCPSIEQTIAWILDKYNIYITVEPDDAALGYYIYDKTGEAEYSLLSKSNEEFMDIRVAYIAAIKNVLGELIEDGCN